MGCKVHSSATAAWLLLALAAAGGTHCVSTKHARQFHKLAGPAGTPIAYQRTTVYSVALFGVWPLIGDASLSKSVAEFTKAAGKRGAGRAHITRTESSALWYAYPPISFIFTLTMHEVQGYIYRPKKDRARSVKTGDPGHNQLPVSIKQIKDDTPRQKSRAGGS